MENGVEVRLPPSLRRFNGGKEILTIASCKLDAFLAQLIDQCPLLKPYLFNSRGQLSGYINIYVNSQDFSRMDKEAIIQKTDQVEILTSLVGG